MEATKFIKPEKLVEYYDQEIREALSEHELYDIELYGWREFNPDYSGYAERITNPRIDLDILSLAFEGKKLPVTTRDDDIEIMALGSDFIEAMKGAYLMLGQSLFFSKHEQEDISTTYGSANLNGAVFQLNIASDRIRDYYVYALTGNNFETYHGNDKTKKEYYRFFDYALKLFKSNAEVLSYAKAANDIAKDVQKRRKVRNKMVHELASQNAKLQKGFFKNQKDNKSSLFPVISLFPDDIPENIDWYKKLVNLGNLVFLIETKTRKNK